MPRQSGGLSDYSAWGHEEALESWTQWPKWMEICTVHHQEYWINFTLLQTYLVVKKKFRFWLWDLLIKVAGATEEKKIQIHHCRSTRGSITPQQRIAKSHWGFKTQIWQTNQHKYAWFWTVGGKLRQNFEALIKTSYTTQTWKCVDFASKFLLYPEIHTSVWQAAPS